MIVVTLELSVMSVNCADAVGTSSASAVASTNKNRFTGRFSGCSPRSVRDSGNGDCDAGQELAGNTVARGETSRSAASSTGVHAAPPTLLAGCPKERKRETHREE